MSNLTRFLVLAALAIPTHALADQADSRIEPAARAEAAPPANEPKMRQAVIVDDLVEFEAASARVYSATRERIQRIAKTWRSTGATAMITVHGYSDSLDHELAEQRANRIRGYLVRYGVDADRIVTVGHSLRESSNWTLGRRAELVIGDCDDAPMTCQALDPAMFATK
jgi:outer membrane protein OmpA-like peptidoglycan-associated protein